jgi:ketosteroid isomerase-like protein
MARSNREAVDAFFAAINRQDWSAVEKLIDPAYVWEMPQSGERVRGVRNNREMNEN